MGKKTRTVKIHIGVAFLLVLAILLVFLFTGDNLTLIKSLFSGDMTSEQLWDATARLGFDGYVTIALLSMLQVLFPFLPAEPVQVLAGAAYGFRIGFLCCLVGFFIGASAIFVLYKIFGERIHKYFVKNLTLDFASISSSQRLSFIIVLLYFLPAIPYGMICFFVTGTGMKYPKYIFLNVLAAIPSICIGIGLGHMAVAASWIFSVCIFAALLILLIVVIRKKDWCFAKINALAAKPVYSSKTTVRRGNRFLLHFLYAFVKCFFFLRGVRTKVTKKPRQPLKGPCIVLCSHGSFVDFYFAAKLLRKYEFNFVTARLYFYHKYLGRLLKALGCFPKSMFATDLESTKNCIRVLQEGRILAMMPEARLSTAGCFEDIQSNTYSFIKKSAVPVYTVCFRGDYLADPKWGKGFRRGSLVEAEMELLFTGEELKDLSVEEIGAAVEKALYYDEFAWLKARPNIRYRSRRIAEGLENILSVCPHCGARHTIVAKGRTVSCANCGILTTVDSRYGFAKDFRFENLSEWYCWQKSLLAKQIENDPNYFLQSAVQLRHSDPTGKSLTRPAGEGVCTLNREGLRYIGTRDGEEVDLFFPLEQIYRLLFGAGENFEIYQGNQIFYFVPDNRASAVDWYLASAILYDLSFQKDKNKAVML